MIGDLFDADGFSVVLMDITVNAQQNFVFVMAVSLGIAHLTEKVVEDGDDIFIERLVGFGEDNSVIDQLHGGSAIGCKLLVVQAVAHQDI